MSVADEVLQNSRQVDMDDDWGFVTHPVEGPARVAQRECVYACTCVCVYACDTCHWCHKWSALTSAGLFHHIPVSGPAPGGGS